MHENMMRITEQTVTKTVYRCLKEFGTGTMVEYNPSKGIKVCYSHFHLKKPYDYNGIYDISNMIEINYCLTGCYDCEFEDQTLINYSDGDFAIASGVAKVIASDSSARPYNGITIFIDPAEIGSELSHFIQKPNINLENLINKTFSGKTCLVAKPGKKILHIFTELYELPASHENDYIRIKVMELLLLLYTGEFKYREDRSKHFSKLVIDCAKSTRSYIDEHFAESITISDMARKNCINRNQLMACFKFIYGTTINEYLKKIRMEAALRLVRLTDLKISEIALKVGYSNPGKFAQSFKKIYGMSPLKYRKENTKEM